MRTLTKKEANVYVWAAFGMVVFGALTGLLLNFEGSFCFLVGALLMINVGHVWHPEPRPKPPIRIVFPNNGFLRWTFYSLSLFLTAHGVWQAWSIFV